MPGITTSETFAWAWSIVLICITITMHVTGIVVIGMVVQRFWKFDVTGKTRLLDTLPGITFITIVVAIALAVLHGIESLVWAIAYVRLGVLTSPVDAIVYSFGSMSTRGSSGVDVPIGWGIMGAIESFDGMLLFGISTAFLFTIMARLWRSILTRH